MMDVSPYRPDRILLVLGPDATDDLIRRATRDRDPEVREAALSRCTDATVVAKALNDRNMYVRIAAYANPVLPPEHRSKGLRGPNPVKMAIANNPRVTEEELLLLMSDRDPEVREAAVMSPRATNAVVRLGLKDQDGFVRDSAAQRLRKIER